MKSESIHRVAGAFGQKAHYDTKIKTWTIGSKVFTVGEIGKMSAGGLRQALGAGILKHLQQTAPASANKKAPRKPKAAKKTAGRKNAFADDAKITVLVAANPKRAGSATHAMFAKYISGMTVAECRKLGISTNSLRLDIAHKFIAVK